MVATVMSNLGLEWFLKKQNLKLIRTQVGDRYVLEYMLANGFNLGGEQSGHMLFLDHNTTGDGLVSALKILELMAESGRKLSELDSKMETVPQILKNVVIEAGSDPLADKTVQKAISSTEAKLKDRGRVLVRKSGTEPKVRVMVEGESLTEITEIANDLCQLIKKNSGV